MSILRAFRAEALRSLDFRGRTPRAQYLGFLLVSVALVATAIWLAIALLPPDLTWAGVGIVIALAYVPVTSAGVRRLHDANQSGTLMFDPIKPLAAFGICLLLVGALLLSSQVGLIALFLALALLGKLAVAVVSIAGLLMLVLSLIYFSNTMGLLLLPSHPGTNAYGPDPNGARQ